MEMVIMIKIISLFTYNVLITVDNKRASWWVDGYHDHVYMFMSHCLFVSTHSLVSCFMFSAWPIAERYCYQLFPMSRRCCCRAAWWCSWCSDCVMSRPVCVAVGLSISSSFLGLAAALAHTPCQSTNDWLMPGCPLPFLSSDMY